MRYKKITDRFFGLVTKHACDSRTDGQIDRQNYDFQDRASIAASRGKNVGATVPRFAPLQKNLAGACVQRCIESVSYTHLTLPTILRV